MDFDTIAPGATGTESFVVQSDSDFMWGELMATVNDPAAPETPIDPTGLTINITDEGAGRNFYNRNQALMNVAGIGEIDRARDGRLTIPTWIDRASQVNASITSNRADAQDVRVRLSFIGFKIFSRSQAGMR